MGREGSVGKGRFLILIVTGGNSHYQEPTPRAAPHASGEHAEACLIRCVLADIVVRERAPGTMCGRFYEVTDRGRSELSTVGHLECRRILARFSAQARLVALSYSERDIHPCRICFERASCIILFDCELFSSVFEPLCAPGRSIP